MKTRAILTGISLVIAIASPFHAHAAESKTAVVTEAKIGEAAPDFTLKSASGKTVHLKDLVGKVVVLEWLNYDCPFVKKHYESGNMQKIQGEETGKGAQWFSIISSAKGKQGHYEPKEIVAKTAKFKAVPTAVLIDEDGKVGKLYGAKTTPHMYVIDAQGKLAYAGAIDDQPSTDQEDIATSKNYVRQAVSEVMAGKTVTTKETTAYGCGIKYL